MRVHKAFQSLQESRMNSHKNARLTPLGRVHLVRQIIRIDPKAAAAQAGISTRRAHTWRKRWHDCGTRCLCNRSSRPVASPRRTQPDKWERIIRLRCNYPLPYAQIACCMGLSIATVGRICLQAGAARLPSIEAAPSKHHYERQISTTGRPCGLHETTDRDYRRF